MSARYGSRTRSGEAVSGWGTRPTGGGGGGAWVMTEETFTSPGTWTCPPTVTQVEVIVVGGGGGGGGSSDTSQTGGGGGGGGVRTSIVSVSGPIPVTVGAGGSGANVTAGTPATAGGVSAFGPLGPGPVPAIPASTVACGGGGAGSSQIPSETNRFPLNAPPIGGGGGGLGYNYYPLYSKSSLGGRYGYCQAASPTQQDCGGGGAGDTNKGHSGGRGKLGFGYGAPSRTSGVGRSSNDSLGHPAIVGPNPYSPTGFVFDFATPGGANTGNGGGAGLLGPTSVPAPLVPSRPSLRTGGDGGSGVVIVRYWSAP